MREALREIDRLAPARRPSGRPVGYQTWTDLLFVHWPVIPEALAPLIPSRLTLDTFQGFAWVGLVAFDMSGVRPRWFPALPGCGAFHETNIRTYVHRDGEDPGVWFFSLDASNSLAVEVAKRRWMLPYHRSEMTVERQGTQVQYTSKRLWPSPPGVVSSVAAEIGDVLPAVDQGVEAGHAAPGTLEHFLIERYFMYTQSPRGALYRGQVHHPPYPLHTAKLTTYEESLCRALHICNPCRPEHVLFSEGVSVEIFGLEKIAD